MMIYLVAIFLCHYLVGIKSEDYYVIPSSGGMTNCPFPDVECHTFFYYVSHYIQFPQNVTFIFLEGLHETYESGLLLEDLNEVTLKGLGEWVHSDDNSSKMESTVTINCYSPPNTYYNCIYVKDVTTFSMERLTINYHYYGTGEFDNVLDIRIIQSFFNTSEVNVYSCGKLTIYNSFISGNYFVVESCPSVNITSSSFAMNTFDCYYCSCVIIDNTTFYNTAIDIQLYESQNKNNFLDPSIIINNSIMYKQNNDSGLVYNYIHCHQSTTVSLSNVTASRVGMYFDGECHIIFKGAPSVIANNHSPYNGGGIMIANSQSTITSDGNTTVSFINNTSEGLGGAIYIRPAVVLFLKNSDSWNANWKEVCSFRNFRPIFINNSASIAGDNVYGGVYFDCTREKEDDYLLVPVPETLLVWTDCDESNLPLIKYFPRPISSYISTNPILVCLCTDINTTECSMRTLDKEIYPGQDITLSLVTVGQCGGISPSGLVVTSSIGVQVVTYSNNQWTGKACLNFTYGIKQSFTNTTSGQLTVSLGKNDEYINLLFSNLYNSSALIINIKFLSCPLGLSLHHSNGICVCNDILTKLERIACNISNVSYPISRYGNNWLYYSHQDNCTVAYTNCPFDYCNTSTVYLNLNQSDLQCTHNRSGILCGQCQEGQSVLLGSNQCGYCDNKYLLLIVAFIVAGLLLVIFLLMTNLTISAGSINGLLFYANIIKLNEANLFDGTSIPVLTQFISWINLDLGIETCLFNGLDDYMKTWLQFIFPVYIWLLVIGLIIGCHYSFRISRYCGNNSVPVLATLIVMSFTKLSRNITKGLMISSIKCDGRQWRNVWSVDGNIEYLSGEHIPLFVVSLISLLIGLIYTVMIFCSQWLQRYGGKYCRSSFDPYVRLKPFIDAHTGPYKDKYRFWTGLLLIIRFILTGVFPYTTEVSPQLNNSITVFVSCFLLTFVRGKYKKKYNTILEMFYLSNLFITSLLNILSNSLELNINRYVNGVSVGLSLVVFIGILSVDVCVIVKKKYGMKFMMNRRQRQNKPLQQPVEESSDNNEEEYSPAHIVNRRESLIFDFEFEPTQLK